MTGATFPHLLDTRNTPMRTATLLVPFRQEIRFFQYRKHPLSSGLDERALVREVDGPAPSLTVYDLDADGGHQYAKHGQKQEAAEREVPPACAQINQ